MEHKVLAIIVVTIMVLSGLAVLGGTVAAQPSPGGHTATALSQVAVKGHSASPSASFALNPTTYYTGSSPSDYFAVPVHATGGTFASGSTVYFYLSTSDAASGIIGETSTLVSSTDLGFAVLPASTTTLSNVITFNIGNYSTAPAAGSYYVLASNAAPGSSTTSAQFFLGPAVQLITVLPTITLSPLSDIVGSTVTVLGTGFDPGSTIAVAFSYPGNTTIASATATLSGAFKTTFTVPTVSGVPYTVVAQETNSFGSSFPEGGITAQATFTVDASIVVSPFSIDGSTSASFTITGTGFVAGSTIGASTPTTTSPDIEVGGILTYHSAVTVSGDGSFTLSGITLSTAISPSSSVGPETVTVTTSPSSDVSSFSDAIYISSPNVLELGFSFSVTPLVGSYNYPGSSVSAAVWNFPASTSVNVYLGAFLLGTVVTNSLGFAELSTAIPGMPAGIYTPMASAPSQSIDVSSSSITVSAYYAAYSSGYLLSSPTTSGGVYVSNLTTITVDAYGLLPGVSYYANDSALVTSASGFKNIVEDGYIVNVAVGSQNLIMNTLVPANNGTLIFTYSPDYISSTSASSASSITLESASGVSVSGYDALSIGYMPVAEPTVTVSVSSVAPGSTFSVTISNIIPYGAEVSADASDLYNLYLGTTELSYVSSGVSTNVIKSSSGSFSASTFTVPTSFVDGPNALYLVYDTQSVSNEIASTPLLVSTAATSLNSGSLVVYSTSSGFDAVGYNLLPSSSDYTLYYFTAAGISSGTSIPTDSNGAFNTTITVTSPTAGTYLVLLVGKSGTTYHNLSGTYSISASLTLSSIPPIYSGMPVSYAYSGLISGVNYEVFVGSMYIETFTSDGSGFISFSAPNLVGTFDVNVTFNGAVAVSAPITISPTIILTPGLAAFPTEPVSFSWLLAPGTYSPSVSPDNPATTPGAGPIQVTVYVNGSPIAMVQALYSSGPTLSGTFEMPNGVAGTVYNISFSYSQSVSTTTSGYTPYGTTTYLSAMSDASAPIVLSTGSGAFVVSISTSTLVATIQTAIGNAMKVPLSQLNASIKAINATAVLISTKFGEMNTTLGILNASVSQILQNSLVLTTDLGNVQVTLSQIDAQLVSFNSSLAVINTTAGQLKVDIANLNASLAAFNGNIISIKTSLGTMSGTLASINGTVSSNAAGISTLVGSTATISTNLGTLSGTVTSVSNGQATIQTKLGNLTTAVGNIQTKTSNVSSSLSNTLIFEIVILVLVVITLALVAVVIMRGGKQSPPKEYKEEPKQPKQ
jgi:hypothetical protein